MKTAYFFHFPGHNYSREVRKLKKKKHSDNGTDGDIDAFDMVNRYGTYNIQPTADTENEFPAIKQGIAKS